MEGIKMKDKEFNVFYREKGNTKGEVFQTVTTAANRKEVIEHSKYDLEGYKVVKIELKKL